MPPDEAVDLVDARDRVVGSATVRRCLEGGLLHRAVAVLVIRRSGKFVLQQRSRQDLWHPGLWTISCTGHVKRGETYGKAAKRELFEELGLKAKIDWSKKYLVPPMAAGRLTEHEWVTLYTCRTDSACTIDPVELEGIKEATGPELRKILEGGTLTPDADLILRDYLGPAPR